MAIIRFTVFSTYFNIEGHTRRKWYSFSTIRKLHLVHSRFSREIFECLPISVSNDNLNLVNIILNLL